MIKIFYDVETTGTNYKIHSIHQLAGLIEVDGLVVEEFDFKIRPHHKAKIEPEAMTICNKTVEQIMAYNDMWIQHAHITHMLNKYIDRYNPKQKAYLVGYNNRSFDDHFLRMFFELCGNTFFGAYFWSDSQDAMVSASMYLQDRRPDMPSFKLRRVATELGIVFDIKGVHDALFDAKLTREIYRITTGLQIEI